MSTEGVNNAMVQRIPPAKTTAANPALPQAATDCDADTLLNQIAPIALKALQAALISFLTRKMPTTVDDLINIGRRIYFTFSRK